MKGGIYIGAVGLGGSNDIASLYGNPGSHKAKIIRFMSEASVTTLNLGMASFVEGVPPSFFAHNLSAGKTIAPAFEVTVNERGLKPLRRRQRIIFSRVVKQHPVEIRWKNATGATVRSRALEAVAHALPRVDKINGLPGTPQPGLGVKVFPAEGFWRWFKMFREIARRGIISRITGNPLGLFPGDKLQRLEVALQPSLQVGEDIEFSFHDDRGNPENVPIQGSGDFLGRAPRVRIHALAPFPNFLVNPNSPMARLHAALLGTSGS